MKELYKGICRDCMEKICPVNGHVLRATGVKERADKPVPWQSMDEELWQNGKVLCPDSTQPKVWSQARRGCRKARAHEAVGDGALLVIEEGS